MSWADAQSYCRSKNTDLAIVDNEEELVQLNQVIGGFSNVWIGLRPDPDTWKWSIENQNYYGEGEADFRMWGPGEPSAGLIYYKVCVAILRTGDWDEQLCNVFQYFICYDGKKSHQWFCFYLVLY